MCSSFAQRQLSFYIHEVRFSAAADLVYVLMYSLLLLFKNYDIITVIISHSLFFDCPYTSNKTDRPDARLRHARVYFRASRQNYVCDTLLCQPQQPRQLHTLHLQPNSSSAEFSVLWDQPVRQSADRPEFGSDGLTDCMCCF